MKAKHTKTMSVPNIRRSLRPAGQSQLQAEVDLQAQLDNTTNLLLRKCGTRDCLQEHAHSFRKGSPAEGHTYLHAFCKALNCRTCGPKLVEYLHAKLTAAVQRYGLYYCYTFTYLDSKGLDPFVHMMNAVRLLKASHKRSTGEKLRYIIVKSLGEESNRAHLHLLTDTDWSEEWIRAWWFERTKADIVYREDNTNKPVARLVHYMIHNYLRCYLGGVNLKKISASTGIDIAIRPPKRKDGQPSEWTRWEASTRSVAVAAFGHSVKDNPINPTKLFVPPKAPAIAAPPACLPANPSAPPRRLTSISSRAAVAEGSEGAQPPLDPKAPAARAAGDEHAPGTVTP